MTDSKSLIQQRIALDRRRTVGIVIIVIAGLLLGIEAVLLITGSRDNAFRWFTAVVMLVWLAGGISQVVIARSRQKLFEAAHGPDAGKQQTVGL